MKKLCKEVIEGMVGMSDMVKIENLKKLIIELRNE